MTTSYPYLISTSPDLIGQAVGDDRIAVGRDIHVAHECRRRRGSPSSGISPRADRSARWCSAWLRIPSTTAPPW